VPCLNDICQVPRSFCCERRLQNVRMLTASDRSPKISVTLAGNKVGARNRAMTGAAAGPTSGAATGATPGVATGAMMGSEMGVATGLVAGTLAGQLLCPSSLFRFLSSLDLGLYSVRFERSRSYNGSCRGSTNNGSRHRSCDGHHGCRFEWCFGVRLGTSISHSVTLTRTDDSSILVPLPSLLLPR
jgi:hypothetical protein